jgi:hypothetical protein
MIKAEKPGWMAFSGESEKVLMLTGRSSTIIYIFISFHTFYFIQTYFPFLSGPEQFCIRPLTSSLLNDFILG